MEENGLPSTPPVNKPSTSPSDKKLAAGLTAVLLGSLGIHKFILGYQTQGLIMLLVSVLGGVVTCGASTGVMGVIGLVEGIIYLTKTDEEFDAMYVTGRKLWF
ncbi:MAG: TM2 domain-containing protein [Fibrobacterota bacterium]|nr:TM2 domain-containing protein [Fibrobacterota bacterium]QQS05930.1 MAG: TM2 domain-containing protein [Fibrobacterota bacterium]